MTKDQTPSREEVIQWGVAAGLPAFLYPDLISEADWTNINQFAFLAYAAGVEAEREEIAQFLESTQLGSLPDDTALHYARLLKGFAEGIRARKENT